MITVDCYETQTGKVERIGREQVPANLRQEGTILWVDLQQPGDEELDWLRDTFHFHPLAMEDVKRHQERAKIDRYDNYYFFILHAIEYDTDRLKVDIHETDLFIDRDYLVSIHGVELPGLDEVRNRLKEARLPQGTTSFLTYLITDSVVDHYFPAIDDIGDLIDELDAAIIEKPDRESMRKIFRLRRNLLLIRKHIAPLRDALNELIRGEESEQLFPNNNARMYFSDIYDHVLRLTDFVDTYRDMLSGSIDAYQSSLSNVLNVNIQRLTVAATILATGTLITGFFGMNENGAFIHSPWPYGGWVILGVLLVLTMLEIWYFRRIGWI